MKSTAMFRGALALVPMVLLAACDPPAPICESSPTIVPQDGADGKGGTNGLSALGFHAISDELIAATGVALADQGDPPMTEGVLPVSEAIKSAFLNGNPVGSLENGAEIRRQIFAHAVQCAVGTGVTLDDGERTYPGGGMLMTTGGWLQKGLTTDAAEDLLTCLTVLLNPSWKGVPVFLSGPSVPLVDDPAPHVEALWAVSLADGVRPEYFVWPILDPAAAAPCAAESANPWQYRVCGSNEKNCGLRVQEDLWDKECEEVPVIVDGVPEMNGFHYECVVTSFDGNPVKKRAIRTALTTTCHILNLFCPAPPPV